MRLLVAAFFLFCTTACASARAPGSNASPDSGLRLQVASVAQETTFLPGVKVIVLLRDGAVREVGKTDEYGIFVLPRQFTKPSIARAVLLCHPLFYCAALRVDTGTLEAYDEDFVSLAPLVLQ